MTEVTVAATRKVLTPAEQVKKFYDLSAEYLTKAKALEAKLAAESAFANVGAGDVVVFTLGRAETKRTLTGSVIARGEVDGKDVVKIIAGEGLNTAVYQVPVSQLDAVNPAVCQGANCTVQAGSVEPHSEECAAEHDAAFGVVDQDQADVDALLAGLSPETEAALNAVQLG